MRWRSLAWFLASLICFAAAIVCWRLAEDWQARKPARSAKPARVLQQAGSKGAVAGKPTGPAPMVLLSQPGSASLASPKPGAASGSGQTPGRLSNTTRTVSELARTEHAILLENALLDTERPVALAIPEQLRAQGDPGSYIVQARGALDNEFRARLKAAGAGIVSYIPNNAYLVRLSAAGARQMAALPQTQSVLPYEPYYKLNAELLSLAVERRPLPQNSLLNVLLFPDARETTLGQLKRLGAQIAAEDRSPFGAVIQLRPKAGSLAALAGLPGVGWVEPSRARTPANDLSRVRIAVAVNSVVSTNYLGLTGSNVLVNVNDTGVDATHPDLVGRVLATNAAWLVDSNGHGTHVIGSILGDGTKSTTVSNASGSIMPATNGQFRGQAPAARAYVLPISMANREQTADGVPELSDAELQELAAGTNAFISNNSWVYDSTNYNLAAASYDAAVRDALPGLPGSQPLLYVFAAGNAGGASDDGTNGKPGTVLSPGTAKNVITVGAIEQLRNITNAFTTNCRIEHFSETNTDGSVTNFDLTVCDTNRAWIGMTDSSNQVAGFSSRGNVDLNRRANVVDPTQVDPGRFKPDVVAPGTFVISARSQQWDEKGYYNPTSHIVQGYADLALTSNGFFGNPIFVPEHAVRVFIRVRPNSNSTLPFPNLPIYVRQSDMPDPTAPGGYDFVITSNNVVRMPPDNGPTLDPRGTNWFYGVLNTNAQTVDFDVVTDIVVTNARGDYLVALSNVNNTLGPTNGPYFYRYESGTSMAAAHVSGMLALMQEFFEQRRGRTNSPALMKALLINGARSVGNQYDLEVTNSLNSQGWGVVNLANSLPPGLATSGGASNSMYLFDQSATNALVTGMSQTYHLALVNAARATPMRVTLVWTDPPANPAATMRLVNDLDLIVTNLDNGDVFLGNDILSGNDFNLPWDVNTPRNVDTVNNVENVYLSPRLGTNYTITVVGHRVNVNAVTAHPNDVAQDYALVVSSGNGQLTNALTLSQDPPVSTAVPYVTYLVNTFTNNPDMAGTMLFNERVGASSPLLGTNTVPTPSGGGLIEMGVNSQWHYYVLTNLPDLDFTNAAFAVLQSPDLSLPRMGVREYSLSNATRVEADIDLYASTDPQLTNGVPLVLSNAFKSLGRLGTEVILLSNAVPGQTYYVGVKSEDQLAAEYIFIGIFSREPLGSTDDMGNQHQRFVPVPAIIPDGTPETPGGCLLVTFLANPIKLHRVMVTNYLTHELVGDLVGSVYDGTHFAVLNDHAPEGYVENKRYVYDDSDQLDVPGAIHTHGPGTLNDFAGGDAGNVWRLIMVDNALNHTGYVGQAYSPPFSYPGLFLEKQQDLSEGVTIVLLPGGCDREFIDVPIDAISLTINATNLSGTGPVIMDICPKGGTGSACVNVTNIGAGVSVTIDQTTTPPLIPGTNYVIRLCNLGADPATVYVIASIVRGSTLVRSVITSTNTIPVAIQDDAVTYAYNTNRLPFNLQVSGLDVGVRINHPRISDLVLTLISPGGTRILLFEDRGAYSTNGLGTFGFMVTNMVSFHTNDFDSVPSGWYAPGALFGGWSVLSNMVTVDPDWTCLCESNRVLVLRDGVVSNSLPTTLPPIIDPMPYELSFRVTHAPYLVGMVGWWPFDEDGRDIFGGHDGLLCGNVAFATGLVSQAYFGDGTATSVKVPQCPDLDVGQGRGFTIEGWINPSNRPITSLVATGALVMSDGFENAIQQYAVPAGSIVSGWLVQTGEVNVLAPNFGFVGLPDSGTNCLELNGTQPGSISTNLNTVPGTIYLLSFAFANNPNPTNPPGFEAEASLEITGQAPIRLRNSTTNSYTNLNWGYTSLVFTATSAVTTLQLSSMNTGRAGMYLDSFSVSEVLAINLAAPLAEWYDLSNASPVGVQFWLSGLPGTNRPGALWANIWESGTNPQPHIIATDALAITNGGWQHVALTYETNSQVARIYTNGQLAVAQVMALTNALPRTMGDLYFGYHPDVPGKAMCFAGGLDEFSLYNRQLSDCEVLAICNATNRGKYGTNALVCPVAVTVELPGLGQTFNFMNGANWTNTGPRWETNYLSFQLPTNNWPADTPIIVRPTDPADPANLNAALDDFVLSGLTNRPVDGLLHFTEDTNLALVPIKFAQAPYVASNFPPTAIFTNDCNSAPAGLYLTGTNIPGSLLPSAVSNADWLVVRGPVSVISNSVFGVSGTNQIVALAAGTVQSTLPTLAGHHYQLSYAFRGPCAVSWWNGDVDPLSGRARDLLGGNHGAFFDGATNLTGRALSRVGNTALSFFDSALTNFFWTNKIELGDPVNLRFTNGFTIETWIKPVPQTNGTFTPEKVEQLFFRGDSRYCLDPYYLALEQTGPASFDVVFHVEDGGVGNCGVNLETGDQPVAAGRWQHLAAVFETNVRWTDNPPWPTNELRLYLNGTLLTNVFLEDAASATNGLLTSFTRQAPFADLDPAYSPGVAIGNRSRYEALEPYWGYMDELTVYARALTGPEIAGIATNGAAGKADLSRPPELSLAKLRVLVDGVERDIGYGDNSSWTTRTIDFYAVSNNSQVVLQSLLPGTLLREVILTEFPPELHYLPEVSLDALNGESANGIWQLEIRDTRVGATNTAAELVEWQLTFQLTPSVPLPVVHLVHGIPYSNRLPAGGVQYLVVDVPQWAVWATNLLENATQPVGVLFDNTNQFPADTNNALFWPPVTSGLTNLTTNTLAAPYLVPGQSYYLAITNPNPFAAAFTFGVWFDITLLTNCEYVTNLVVGPAGIPRYFQFDVPTNATPPESPAALSFWLTKACSNLTVVLSEHLPLPDLDHYDYISQQPCTNDEVVMVVTNNTPWPLQTNRWYVGVFNHRETNVTFDVQACYQTNYPTLIPLTNGVPYYAWGTNQYVAPPGPPRGFFFEFQITNLVEAALFELYDLSGDADLLLQRNVPPGMAPYFDTSLRWGTTPEQIVVRTNCELPDLRGDWYLGVYNHELTNVAYTIRAIVTAPNGLLISGLPIRLTTSPLVLPRHYLLRWNAVEGEHYEVRFTANLVPPVAWTVAGNVAATTPCATFEIVAPLAGIGFYRIVQVPAFAAISLANSVTATNTVAAGRFQYYTVFVPPLTEFATNTLWSAALPVNVWFNQTNRPTGRPEDFLLITNAVNGRYTLDTNSIPPLVPGRRYFLGVENTNCLPVSFDLEVELSP